MAMALTAWLSAPAPTTWISTDPFDRTTPANAPATELGFDLLDTFRTSIVISPPQEPFPRQAAPTGSTSGLSQFVRPAIAFSSIPTESWWLDLGGPAPGVDRSGRPGGPRSGLGRGQCGLDRPEPAGVAVGHRRGRLPAAGRAGRGGVDPARTHRALAGVPAARSPGTGPADDRRRAPGRHRLGPDRAAGRPTAVPGRPPGLDLCRGPEDGPSGVEPPGRLLGGVRAGRHQRGSRLPLRPARRRPVDGCARGPAPRRGLRRPPVGFGVGSAPGAGGAHPDHGPGPPPAPRPGRRRVAASPFTTLVIVVGGSYLVLSTTRNAGSDFELPMLPAAVLLVIGGAARARPRPAAAAAGLLAVLATVSYLGTSGLLDAIAGPDPR